MDLRSGVNVPISSVPFHVPMSHKEGKFPLRDIRYYYVTSRTAAGNLKTKLFICHSGFYFSARSGTCSPSFMHEYVLAGSSYKLGVNLIEQARMTAFGTELIGHTGVELNSRIARMTIGSSGLSVLQDPKIVFGTEVGESSVAFELSPCSTSGYFPTPDYRIYFTCVAKSDRSATSSSSTNNNVDLDDTNSQHDGDDEDDDSFAQTIFTCPSDLFFSEFYGFCVAPYVHQFIGLNRLDHYLWGGHKLREEERSNTGIPMDQTSLPWEIPTCSKLGKVSIRDPRYYVSCQEGQEVYGKVFLCPTNTYFNSHLQKCVAVKECDCWFKIGYLADPFPRNAYGQEIDIFIHLDRAYLNLLRQALGPVVRRSVQAGRNDGKAVVLVKKLICFWRDMEKYRTLQYQYTTPPPGASSAQKK